jgi:hypothetical protein
MSKGKYIYWPDLLRLIGFVILITASGSWAGWTTTEDVRGIADKHGKTTARDVDVVLNNCPGKLIDGAVSVRKTTKQVVTCSLLVFDETGQLACANLEQFEGKDGNAEFHLSIASNLVERSEVFVEVSEGKYENERIHDYMIHLGTFKVLDCKELVEEQSLRKSGRKFDVPSASPHKPQKNP